MTDRRDSGTFYDVLMERAIIGGGGEPVAIKRTVYGTSEDEIYELSDGMLYRVRRDRSGD